MVLMLMVGGFVVTAELKLFSGKVRVLLVPPHCKDHGCRPLPSSFSFFAASQGRNSEWMEDLGCERERRGGEESLFVQLCSLYQKFFTISSGPSSPNTWSKLNFISSLTLKQITPNSAPFFIFFCVFLVAVGCLAQPSSSYSLKLAVPANPRFGTLHQPSLECFLSLIFFPLHFSFFSFSNSIRIARGCSCTLVVLVSLSSQWLYCWWDSWWATVKVCRENKNEMKKNIHISLIQHLPALENSGTLFGRISPATEK